MLMVRRRRMQSKDDMPEWMHELKGFDLLEQSTQGQSDDEMWRFSLTLPNDLTEISEHIDPLLALAILMEGIGGIEDKIGDVVRFCRSQGRTWTQIGDALGMSKQAAWERFSDED